MVILTISTGIIVWTALDYIVHRSIRSFFETHITERLKQQAQEDRLRFDNYLNDFQQLAQLFSTREQVRSHIEQLKWYQEKTDNIIVHNRYPSWFPGRSLMRSLASPRFVIFFDSHNDPKEIFHRKQDQIPDSILHPSDILLENSDIQAHITSIANFPYIITSKQVNDPSGLTSTILLASPIDDELFIFVQGDFPKHLMGIISSKSNTVLTSSDSILLPGGTDIDEVRKKYLFTVRDFQDYGDAELSVNFVSFIPRKKIQTLANEFVGKERQYRAIIALSLIMTFTLLIIRHSLRIEKLIKIVKNFAQSESYGLSKNEGIGDQMSILETTFKHLINEIGLRTKQLNKSNQKLTSTISSLKQTRDELIRAEKFAAVGQMAGIVAHEILNPITAISIRLEKNLSISQKAILVFNKQQQTLQKLNTIFSSQNSSPIISNEDKNNFHLLNDINKAQLESQVSRISDLEFLDRLVIKIIKIADGFRQFSKSEKKLEPVNLNLIIQEVVDDLHDTLKKCNIKIILQLSQPEAFQADYMELYLVFSNLLRNAIQAIEMHTQPQKKIITVSLSTTKQYDTNIVLPTKSFPNKENNTQESNRNKQYQSNKKWLELLVQDTGTGIPKSDFDKIFEPDFTTKGKNGTGIGLSVSRKIVRSYLGDLSVLKSTPGQGTIFQVLLYLNQSTLDRNN